LANGAAQASAAGRPPAARAIQMDQQGWPRSRRPRRAARAASAISKARPMRRIVSRSKGWH